MALSPTEEAQTRELLAQQAAILSLAESESIIVSKLGATKVNLSQLPAASALNNSDILLVRQGTNDRSISGNLISPVASETVQGKAEVATQAETDAGTDNTRIVPPLKLRNGFAVSLTNNGYIKFPSWLGGLIFQWGTLAKNYSPIATSATVNFPLSHPNSVFQVLLSRSQGLGDGANGNFDQITESLTNSNFSVVATQSTNTNTFNVRWVSVGY